jgi:hypothetical protein
MKNLYTFESMFDNINDSSFKDLNNTDEFLNILKTTIKETKYFNKKLDPEALYVEKLNDTELLIKFYKHKIFMQFSMYNEITVEINVILDINSFNVEYNAYDITNNTIIDSGTDNKVSSEYDILNLIADKLYNTVEPYLSTVNL